MEPSCGVNMDKNIILLHSEGGTFEKINFAPH